MTAQLSPMRTGRITASRVPIILGLSPYQKRDDLIRTMVRDHFGAPSEFTGNDLTAWGNDHEEDARAAYEAKHGKLVLDAQDFIVHPDYEWCGCSPDGLLGADGMFEAKCPPPRRGKWTSFAQKTGYLAQIQFQLACTGRQWCHAVIWRPDDEAEYLGCSPLIVEVIDADPDWLPAHLDVLAAFRAEYLAIITDPALTEPFLADLDRTDADWKAAAFEYHAADSALGVATGRMDAAKARLRELAGDAPARGCGVQVLRSERAGSVDWRKAAEKYAPDADVESFRKPGSVVWTVRSAAS